MDAEDIEKNKKQCMCGPMMGKVYDVACHQRKQKRRVLIPVPVPTVKVHALSNCKGSHNYRTKPSINKS